MFEMEREHDARYIGERIRWLRKRLGYTQKDLAELLGISVPTLIGFEKGRNTPGIAMTVKMSQVLHCPLDSILVKELYEQYRNGDKIVDPRTGECFLFEKK